MNNNYSINLTRHITALTVYFEKEDHLMDVMFHGDNPHQEHLLDFLSEHITDDMLSIDIISRHPAIGVISIEFSNGEEKQVKYKIFHKTLYRNVGHQTDTGYGSYTIVEIISLSPNSIFDKNQYSRFLSCGYLSADDATNNAPYDDEGIG